jgi:hypothetical protein
MIKKIKPTTLEKWIDQQITQGMSDTDIMSVMLNTLIVTRHETIHLPIKKTQQAQPLPAERVDHILDMIRTGMNALPPEHSDSKRLKEFLERLEQDETKH